MYAFVGADRFLRNEAVADLIATLSDRGVAPERVPFNGADAPLAEVLDDVRTGSLLGGRRVIVVDEADRFITAHRAALERYCAEPSPTGCLVLLCHSLPRNTRLYKIIQQHGVVTPCDPPKGRGVESWLAGRAASAHGKRLGTQACRTLRQQLGDALGSLDAELSKLAAYVGDRDDITPADIHTLTGQHREEKVFAVTDAMSAGDVAGALRHWEQVLATDRSAPGRAIAGLAWSVRRMLQTLRDWKSGTSLHELARRMYTDPDALRRRLATTSVDALEAQQRDLLAADLAGKTGASTAGAVVERFIVKHSVRKKAAVA